MFTISKTASMTNVSTDTVRYYEKEGLLSPATRSESGYRLYTDEAVRRLNFIRHAQQCGFSLPEIRELLELSVRNDSCCNDVRSVAIEKKLQLEQKIRALQAMSRALTEMINICIDTNRPLDECPILGALENSLNTCKES